MGVVTPLRHYRVQYKNSRVPSQKSASFKISRYFLYLWLSEVAVDETKKLQSQKSVWSNLMTFSIQSKRSYLPKYPHNKFKISLRFFRTLVSKRLELFWKQRQNLKKKLNEAFARILQKNFEDLSSTIMSHLYVKT